MTEQSDRTMLALVKSEDVESYELKTIPVPTPAGDEVLIKVDAVSICGSDIALYKWNDVGRTIATLPFIPGHECTGTVVSKGPQATLDVGQRIAVENHYFCGKCYQCLHDRGDICQNMGQYGHGKTTMHGGCSQFSIVPSKYCYTLNKDISADEAVLLEPLGVAHNGIEQLEVKGEDVLIIGTGAIGLLGCSLAKLMGAKRVIATDVDAKRLIMAKGMGADICINGAQQDLHQVIMRETDGVGVGRICEMSGSDVMVNSMFGLLRKGGQVVMVGLPKKPLHVENVLQDILFKSLQLRSIHGRRIFHTWRATESLVAEKKLAVTQIVTHRYPMSEYEEAFKALFSGAACKIILYPNPA